jgi:hypothetical protein
MRIREISAVLYRAAADLPAFAARNDDLNFADQVVLPFVMNFLTNEGLRKFPMQLPTGSSPAECLCIDVSFIGHR